MSRHFDQTGVGDKLALVGRYFMIYALAGILLWVGALKFAAYEAEAVQMFAAESPLLSWLYNIFGVRTFSRLLGVAEILAGVAIALRPLVPWASAVGAAMAIVLFGITLTFLFSSPGAFQEAGFPQLSPDPGQFIAKDLMLLAVAVWIAGESLVAARRSSDTPVSAAAGATARTMAS